MKSILDYIDPNLLPWHELCRKVADDEHFTLSRFGDGEFQAILGYEGQNCDGNRYTLHLSEELLIVLRDCPPYYLGLHQAIKDPVLCAGTVGVIRALGIGPFIPNAIFHDPLKGKGGDIHDFFSALKRREVVIIAPNHLRPAVDLVDAIQFIEIPPVNALDHYNAIMADLTSYDFTEKVALFCAGPAAPIFIHELWKDYVRDATFIDFGSTFDPFCGRMSRSYHRKMN